MEQGQCNNYSFHNYQFFVCFGGEAWGLRGYVPILSLECFPCMISGIHIHLLKLRIGVQLEIEILGVNHLKRWEREMTLGLTIYKVLGMDDVIGFGILFPKQKGHNNATSDSSPVPPDTSSIPFLPFSIPCTQTVPSEGKKSCWPTPFPANVLLLAAIWHMYWQSWEIKLELCLLASIWFSTRCILMTANIWIEGWHYEQVTE